MTQVRRVKGHTSQQIKAMEIGDTLVLSLDKWNAARSITSVLNRDFGTHFVVNKTDEVSITVTRYEDLGK